MVEIACDESGFSGTNLLNSTEPVITHASVDLSRAEAVELIARFGLSPHEMKSGQFLRRPGAGEMVDRFLAALRDRSHVHVIDKEFFLVTRIVDLLLAEPTYAAGTRLTQHQRPPAVALHRAGRKAGHDWDDFLSAFVALVRRKRRGPAQENLERFFRARDALARHAPDDAVLTALDPARVRTVLARLDDDDRSIPPPLEPMLPALAETILHWAAGHRQVLVFHDEQSALTADRLTRLGQALPGRPLAGLVMVDSRDDPRVQVADLLAGVARRSMTQEDLEEGDAGGHGRQGQTAQEGTG
ncbi:hypothetical protein Ate02nite_42650 [Paractinoplanes tereljensis]|uniref:DUF3800 domain-containing protein n=1 Tax=Paractinoplanes tereljensis TaxID=571912 RepID=A0A919NMJ2_9ACTN|nr:hypothetical protein Ate02nite_42650 [Actinoplanes tereljensis]